MATWTYQGQTIRDFIPLVNPVGGAIVADAADPNTTAPDGARVVFTPDGEKQNNLGQVRVLSVASDLACVVEGWLFSPAVNKWLRVFSQALTGTFVVAQVQNIPPGFPFFLRVQANAGSATIVGYEIH